jgi:membrane protease YdiL (CAAX protease family)
VGFVPLFVAGALFGWLFIKSRSLRVAIAAHAAYNAVGLLALFATKAAGVQ